MFNVSFGQLRLRPGFAHCERLKPVGRKMAAGQASKRESEAVGAAVAQATSGEHLRRNHAIYARVSLDTTERCIKRDNLMAGKKLAYARCGIKRFRQADFCGIGKRLYTRRNIHGLSEV